MMKLSRPKKKSLTTSYKLKICSILIICFIYNYSHSQIKGVDSKIQISHLIHKSWDVINVTTIQRVFNFEQKKLGDLLRFHTSYTAIDSNQVYQKKPIEIKEEKEFWYKTTFAFIIYVFVLLSIIILLFQLRFSAIKKQLKIVQSKVDLKTNELKELAESNELYKYALELSNDGFWDYDITNDTVKYSPSIYAMLGYAPYEFEENRYEFYNKIADENEKQNHIDRHNKLISGDDSVKFGSEYKMKKKNGDIIWIQSKSKVVERDKNGLPTRLIGAHTDITSEKRKTQELLEAILKTENIERSRISREIHDGLQQTLIISSLNFQSAKKEVSKLSAKNIEKFEIGWNYLQDSIVESRMVAHSLMPKAIIDFGVISAFESLINQMDKSAENTEFNFLHNFKHEKIKNELIEITLYRILQESINNIVKYAKAKNVTIQLKDYDQMYMLTIEDDGVGFNPQSETIKSRGLGFQSMRNRLEAIDGFLEVDSRVNQGTTIIIQINKSI